MVLLSRICPGPGAVPLISYQKFATSSGLNVFYTPDPSSENLTGYTRSGLAGYVFRKAREFKSVSIPDKVIICGSDCLYSSYVPRETTTAGDGDGYVTASSHWCGLVLKLSDQACSNVPGGLNIATGIAAALALVTLGSTPVAAVVALVAAAADLLAGVIFRHESRRGRVPDNILADVSHATTSYSHSDTFSSLNPGVVHR